MYKLLLGFALFISLGATAQRINASAYKEFTVAEDSLKVYARSMIIDPNSSQRFTADSIFIRMLVKTLRSSNSFHFPFDSLETVSRIYAPDSFIEFSPRSIQSR